MLEFKEENMILTGIIKRESKKTGNEYLVANFLGEDGNTFGCMVDFPVNKADFKQLDSVDVIFRVIPGRYTQLRVKNMIKSKGD